MGPWPAEVLADCSLHANCAEWRVESSLKGSSWATRSLQNYCRPLPWHLQPLEFQGSGYPGRRLMQGEL